MKRALACAVAVLLAAGCGGSEERSVREDVTPAHAGAERVTLSAQALAGAEVATAPVERRPLVDELRATAVIKPNENRLAHVGPRVPGRAIEVLVVLGDRVEPGETLAELDSLELGEKKSTFLQARVSLEVARRNATREERLYRQRISSEKEYLEARGEFERSEAAYRAAREALRLLGLSDEEIDGTTWGGAGHPLSHFPILAPFGGTVIEQHVTLGELVMPESRPYTIADLATLWIVLDVYEKDLARVSVGSEVQVRVDAYPDETFAGRIVYLSHVLDESTRTARARVDVDNHAGRLRPGMFATAIVALGDGTPDARIVVPADAVQRVHGRAVAFVEESPGTYVARTLTLGARGGGLVEIRAGLDEGERVVTAGAFTLKSVLLKDELAGED
jgi:cobalt-zinc-cadmium efflux system membrane fusion protein